MSKKDKSRTKNSFYRRVCGIIIAIVFLGIINFLFSPHSLWIKWIAIIGVLIIIVDFIKVFLINDKLAD
jgi:hypothetical protein